MLSRARQTPAEDGFILIEVLVSALILAIVAGAVLALISATTHSAASGRNRSIAYGIAQEEQARMRTMRISKLKEPTAPREVTRGGTTFTVESSGKFVNSTTGTSSCSGEGASADYVEITSTVSSETLLTPVTMHSIVSPSNGSLDPSHGTFSFQAKNSAGTPLSKVSITGTGAGNFNGFTDAGGCLIFPDIPAGNYSITTFAGAGLVSPQGLEKPTIELNVEASGTQQKTFYFDRPGSITGKFYYLEPNGSKATAAVDSMELYDAEGEPGATTVWATPEHALVTTPLSSSVVYPFKTPYSVYAGSCQSNSPDPKNEGNNGTAVATVTVTTGSATTREIQVPALNLLATYNSGKVQGAKVVATDTECQYNTVNVKREFVTNKEGHIVLPGKEATTTAGAVGLPYGEYSICVSALISGSYRYAKKTLSLKSLAAPSLQTFELKNSSNSYPC
jgi:Tfp pilus assembly protein PilV